MWFVERFCLIISVPVLSTNNVSVGVFLSSPGGLIKQLRVSLESTSNSASSVSGLQSIVEFNLLHGHLGVSVWLRSIVWLQISLSESSAPLFIESWMWGQLSCCSISSVETRTSLIESFLISHEAKKNESLIETYSWLLNLSLVLWNSSSLTKHLLVILVYDLPSSEFPFLPGMNPAYFGMAYDLLSTDF